MRWEALLWRVWPKLWRMHQSCWFVYHKSTKRVPTADQVTTYNVYSLSHSRTSFFHTADGVSVSSHVLATQAIAAFHVACSRRSDSGVRREESEKKYNKKIRTPPPLFFFSACNFLRSPHDLNACLPFTLFLTIYSGQSYVLYDILLGLN